MNQLQLPGIRHHRRKRASNRWPKYSLERLGRLRHVSNEVERCRFRLLERIFAESWMRTCRPVAGLNNGVGTLQELFIHREPASSPFASLVIDLVVSQRDAKVAATVIQWLGTGCGFAFLQRCLNDAKIQIVTSGQRKDAYYFNTSFEGYQPSAWAVINKEINKQRDWDSPFERERITQADMMLNAEISKREPSSIYNDHVNKRLAKVRKRLGIVRDAA